jgi:hypothetical protein
MGCGCKKMSVVEKAASIAEGWKNVIWSSPAVREMAARRAVICVDCPSNKNNVCVQCGCWIPAKARSTREACPLSKW